MGKDCCGAKEDALVQLRARQSKILKIVLLINSVMFFIEFGSGIIAQSTALLADSLDMFGDAVVYAFSLYVLYKSERWRASAALMKGLIMLAFGLGVFGEAIYKAMGNVMPDAPTIGVVGTLALAANVVCLILLLKHKEDDINMKSTWICSRNDIIANSGVLIAAGAVAFTQSKWPDIAVGVIIAGIFLKSSFHLISEAWAGLRKKSELML
ncbi:cation transporter [Oligoflexus tunisiensis]|uniref:cation transporter n=1 Tax=Oligoflexus tunisiensis TaxID=708132 RepID=UPI000AC02AED|nr:cation transporter [Oligoflexus tunisiensis]